MDTYKPVTTERIQAFQFKELNPVVSNKYPIRYVIEDDALSKGHYELWVSQQAKWVIMKPGDWIVIDPEVENGFFAIDQVTFQDNYEPA